MRTSKNKLSDDVQERLDWLLPIVLSDLGTKEKIADFLGKFFTEKEFIVFSKRIAIIHGILKDKSYYSIKKDLKVSSATVASIHHLVEKHSFKDISKILNAEEWADTVSKRLLKIVGR